MSDEPLILVNERNRQVGTAGKTAVHQAGLLHRAFSIFIVDREGLILLQQRSRAKYHSGGLWANSCCGHPRPGDLTLAAARRRLGEELGIDSDLSFGFFARYRAALDNGMQENELVYVYFGPLAGTPQPNPDEVSAIECLSVPEVRRRIRETPEQFTYWFQHYMIDHSDKIERLAAEFAAR